jgi:hypothetical protein
MLQSLFIILGIIILYKLIFGFIIPVYRTSRDIRRRFRDINQQMNERMNQHYPGAQANGQHQRPPVKEKAKKSADYIDFEEIK